MASYLQGQRDVSGKKSTGVEGMEARYDELLKENKLLFTHISSKRP